MLVGPHSESFSAAFDRRRGLLWSKPLALLAYFSPSCNVVNPTGSGDEHEAKHLFEVTKCIFISRQSVNICETRCKEAAAGLAAEWTSFAITPPLRKVYMDGVSRFDFDVWFCCAVS